MRTLKIAALAHLLTGLVLAAPEVHLPASQDLVLPNGVRVFLISNREVPLVSFRIRLAGGSVEDPAGKEGAASVLAALLQKGAGTRSAKEFQEAVDFVGGELSTAATHRWISLDAEFLSKDTDLALELITDVLRRPELSEDEFAKERGLAADAVRASRQEPRGTIATYHRSWLFQGHAYARPPGGDERSLERLGHADVTSAASLQLRPARTWMVIAGDLDPAEMVKKLEAHLGDWTAEDSPPAPVPAPVAATESRVLLVDKPDALQTYFRFGNLSIDWSHRDYPARQVANTILGGRFTSRLNTALRIESGLSYGAGSFFDDTRAGAFTVSTYTATKTSREALELAAKVYREFVADGMTREELDSARTYIKGQYAPDNIETAEQVADKLMEIEFDGVKRDVVDIYYQRLDALSLAEVKRVIQQRFPGEALTWTVIGKAEVLRPMVGQFGEVSEAALAGPGFGPGFR